MVVGVYAMPGTVALFAGQHSFYQGLGLSCDKCHSDVISQLQNGASYEKHKAAAGNSNYTTYLSLGGTNYSSGVITAYDGKVWTWNGNAWQNGSATRYLNLDVNGNGIDGGEICMLCHNSTLFGVDTHVVIVRVCDDDRCHGNRNNFYNSPQFFNKNTSNITAAGYYLSRENIHNLFYLDASNQSSGYGASTSFGQPGNVPVGSTSVISSGYWTCEGCHAGAAINVTIIQEPVYNHSESNAAKKRY